MRCNRHPGNLVVPPAKNRLVPTVTKDGDARCQRCGVALTGQAVGELCANCLLKLALEPPADGALFPEGEPPEAPPGPWPHVPASGSRVRYFRDYELIKEIARGGMGVVYQARQVSLNRPVALKMILAGDFSSPAMIERFQIEARAAARMEHPHIVPVHEIGIHDGLHYFSMRLVDGATLTQAMAGRKFTARRAAELIIPVARAVHHAHHRGILHRDLKPGNILLDQQGIPHVADFGLAKLLEHNQTLTQGAAVMGTPAYMAPHRGQEISVATLLRQTGYRSVAWAGEPREVFGVWVSPDGRLGVTTDGGTVSQEEGDCILWDFVRGGDLARFKGIQAVFSADSRTLFTFERYNANRIRSYDVSAENLMQRAPGWNEGRLFHQGRRGEFITTGALAADGRTLVVAATGVVLFLDTLGGKLLGILMNSLDWAERR